MNTENECIICYEKRNHQEFVSLTCCLKRICIQCTQNIRGIHCPFCRSVISQDDNPFHRHHLVPSSSSNHLDDESYPSITPSSLPHSFFSNSFDAIEYRMSRTDRHRQRRFWKLQERELNREYNRNLNKAIHESKISQKKKIYHDIIQDLLSLQL